MDHNAVHGIRIRDRIRNPRSAGDGNQPEDARPGRAQIGPSRADGAESANNHKRRPHMGTWNRSSSLRSPWRVARSGLKIGLVAR